MLSTARLRLVAGLLAAWAALVGLRLAQVQLLQHEAWSREAAEQQQSTVEVEQPRGEVRTRDGRILAGSLERRALGVSTRLVPRGDWPEVARALAPIAGTSAPEILARFRDAEGFLYLSKDLDPEIEPAVGVSSQHAVRFQCRCQAMGGGAWKLRLRLQLDERAGRIGHGPDH